LLSISIKNNIFTNGGIHVKNLEKYIYDEYKICSDKSVIAVTNGSVAIHLLTSAISYTENINIKWATQSFTFPPSAQSNLVDIEIVDIDNEGGIDLNKINKNINGLIVTNIFGNIVNIEKYQKWVENKNNFLIFDNAATSYTFYKGKNCLNYGVGCTISFHHTKPFGFSEGGAIIVDKKYENNIRYLNNFGIGLKSDEYWNKYGNNYKMSEISAVYILQYLKDNNVYIIKKHQQLYEYFKLLINDNNITQFKLFPNFYNDICVVSCISILLNKNNINNIIINKLLENQIQARKYYHPLTNAPIANDFYSKIICIPCNIDMQLIDIKFIFNIITQEIQKIPEI
jgi:dTDP-4-amino-4,6-dideoxygalactose transaminase